MYSSRAAYNSQHRSHNHNHSRYHITTINTLLSNYSSRSNQSTWQAQRPTQASSERTNSSSSKTLGHVRKPRQYQPHAARRTSHTQPTGSISQAEHDI